MSGWNFSFPLNRMSGFKPRDGLFLWTLGRENIKHEFFPTFAFALNISDLFPAVVLQDRRPAVLPARGEPARPHSAWWRLLQSHPEGAGEAHGRAARPAAHGRPGRPPVTRSRAPWWLFQLGLCEERCKTSCQKKNKREKVEEAEKKGGDSIQGQLWGVN